MRTPEIALDSSPYQQEQKLDDHELASRQGHVAGTVGQFVLKLGEITYSKVDSYYKKVGDYYGSVPESIKNLDLTSGVEARQSSSDEDREDVDSTENGSTAPGEAIEEEKPFETPPEEPEEAPSDDGGESAEEDAVEEDTADNWDDASEARQAVNERLRSEGLSKSTIDEVNRVLDSDRSELIHVYLRNLGVEEEKIEQAAHLLTPVNLYLTKLEELGLPKEKMHEARHFLAEEAGRLRLKHLMGLVGIDKEAELRRLMSTHHDELLGTELAKMGVEEPVAQEVIATPRRNKTKLTQEALRTLGLSGELIDDIEALILKSEIPEDIVSEAERLGIPLETVVKAREAFKRAEWHDTFEYLKTAQTNEAVRERLKENGIEIEPLPGTEAEAAELAGLSLKEINQKYPEEWAAERARRISIKRAELAEMLRKFRAYLPLKDLPLPEDVDVDPEMEIPQDPEDAHHINRAYGVWRNLLAKSYAKRINNPHEYKTVRAELHRVGGPIPLIRKLGQRWLAIRILNNQKRERREAGDRANFGVFGIGYKRYHEIFRAIEQADMDVKDARRALGFWHKNAFTADAQGTPREKLAENIIDIRLREIAFRKGRLNPEIPRQRIDLRSQQEELVT